MKESSGEILHHIEEEYPEQLAEFYEHPNLQPPVKEEYLQSLCEGDEQLTELFEEMIEYFYRYTEDVCEQQSLIKKGIDEESIDEIRSRDIARTRLHNAMNDSVKIFSRKLGEAGKDNSWIDDIDIKGRAGYGRLALLTTYLDIIRKDK